MKILIPFETFTDFERIANASPLFACPSPEWAAAAHAIVVEDTVHYLWARRNTDTKWALMHSFAPTANPGEVKHDPRNPVVVPSDAEGFDDHTVEYPFPFLNPADGKFYAYYLGKRKVVPKQTGLLVRGDDFGTWERVSKSPVIAPEADFEEDGSSHPSIAVDGDTIHIIYTGEARGPLMRPDHQGQPRSVLYNRPTICHATAPTGDSANVTKDKANPVFGGSGAAWDSCGVREAEILRGPTYFHIFYGGYDGWAWRIGHVRTLDFRTFEPNPYNPIFVPSEDPFAWDSGGLLTPQVFEINGAYHMLYAGTQGKEGKGVSPWFSGLAVARGKTHPLSTPAP